MTPRGAALGWAVAALTTSNVVANRLLPDAAYVPWNLGLAAVLVRVARRAGCDDAALRLDPRELRRGGVVGAVGVAAATAVAAALHADERTATAFADTRADATSPAGLWYATLVRIPLGTALAEEVAFRAVLPALQPDRVRGTWAEPLLPAVLFGLWHVLPSRGLGDLNEGVGRVVGAGGDRRVRLLAVAVTAAAGLGLELLARTGRHVLAPTAVHAAVNAVTYALAWRRPPAAGVA